MGNKDMENKTEDMLYKSKSRKYLTVAMVLAAMLLIGAIIGINVYYRIPDVNGHSKMEIKQAKNVILRYVSCLEQGDRNGVLECHVENVYTAGSLDNEMKWTRFDVHDLRYEPDSRNYRSLKKTMEQQSEPQNWVLLTMDCDLTTHYEKRTLTLEWVVMREDESKPWKILRSFKADC